MDQTSSATALPIRGTDALHRDGQYSALAKLFHWVTVPLLALALGTGFVIEHIAEKSKMGFYALHESTGLVILGVALLRLGWRAFSRPPAHPDHLPPRLRQVATATHHLLYAALVIQPLLGFFATNAFGFPLQGETAFLGFIDLPKFMDTHEGLANVLIAVHGAIGWALPVLIAAHVAGAIWHHTIRKDGTLLRML